MTSIQKTKFSINRITHRLLDQNFILLKVLIPLFVLILYNYSYAFLHNNIFSLPESVNFEFVTRTARYLTYISAFFLFIYLIAFKPWKVFNKFFSKKNSNPHINKADFILLLFPLTPIAQYTILNRSVLSQLEIFNTVLLFSLLGCLYIFVIPWLLGFLGSTRVLMINGLVFTFMLTNMALISQTFGWFSEGSLRIQLILFFTILIIVGFFSSLKDKNILRLLIIGIFLVNSTMQFLTPKEEVGSSQINSQNSNNTLSQLIYGKTINSTPNIYLLIYDSYTNIETMSVYGIDNRAQEMFLREKGFVLYPHTYSIASDTLNSMNRVFDISIDLQGRSGEAVSGNGLVFNILKDNGYKTFGIFSSDFFFRTNHSKYDYSLPEKHLSSRILINSILMGEFRFDDAYNDVSQEEFLSTKKGVFRKTPEFPRFVYMHSKLPGHSQNSGKCLPDEIDQYAERLSWANTEMKEDVQSIIVSDPNSIIIIAGDHGPYLTKNCTSTYKDYELSEISREDIQDRFSTFLAIRWPNNDYQEYDEITVLQDVFPAVFAYLYKDTAILEAKIPPTIIMKNSISGASVQNSTIIGGINDGEPLFVLDN